MAFRIAKDDIKPPLFLRFRSSKWYIVAVVSLATFTDVFLTASIVPVVPFALTSRAGVAPENVQHWTAVLLAVNGAVLVAVSPIAGWAADQVGTRRFPMVAGLLALLGASTMLCFGRSIGIFIVARILLGISGAVVWTVGLALVVDTIAKGKIGKYLGYVFMSINMAVLVAPLVGGAVYAAAGYYAVFYLSFGLIAVDVVLRLGLIEKKVARKWLLDEGGSSEASAPVEKKKASVMDEKEKASAPGEEESGEAEAPEAEAPAKEAPCTNMPKKDPALSASAGIHREKQLRITGPNPVDTAITPDPLDLNPIKVSFDANAATIPTSSHRRTIISRTPILALLKSPRVLTAQFGCLVQSTLFSTFDTVLPLHVNALFGWGSLGAGLIFLALLVPSLASPLVGWSNDKLGPKWIAFVGFTLCFPALVLLREVTHDGIDQIVLLCVLLAVIGFGVNFIAIPLAAEISYAIEAKEEEQPGIYGPKGAYAQGYALLNTGFAAGSLIGPLWSGYVVTDAGWGTLGWSLGALCILTTVPIIRWTGGKEAMRGWRSKRRVEKVEII